MLQFQEVAVLDRNSEFRGVPPTKLMENAGKKLAEEIQQRYPKEQIIFLCGTGNNGGDGYVAARYLSEWRGEDDVTVYLIKGLQGIKSELAKKNLDRLECRLSDKIDIETMNDMLVVDALLGTGIKGKIREPYRSLIESLNQIDSEVVSVDVPSGLGADVTVEPELTVTFHDKKVGMYENNCGEIIVKDIGIPDKAEIFTGPGELLLYPTPDDSSHKGDNGSLLIIGGGPYTGAPALAGMAAYRVGVDLVKLAVPRSINEVIAGYSPNFIVHPLAGDIVQRDHVDKILQLSKDCDAVLLGPGLGDNIDTIQACRDIIQKLEKPLILDADGLKSVVDYLSILPKNTVLTPHKGEMKLFKIKDNIRESAEKLAQKYDVTILLKGRVDHITDGERIKMNDFGTSAMTVGGTGDTLAGVVSGLIAKNMDPFDAARLGAYITCRAGELAFDENGWGVIPEDILEEFHRVFMDNK